MYAPSLYMLLVSHYLFSEVCLLSNKSYFALGVYELADLAVAYPDMVLCWFSLAQVGLLGVAMVPYVDSTWGVAHFSVPNESPCMCAFVGDKKTVVGKWGSFNDRPTHINANV